MGINKKHSEVMDMNYEIVGLSDIGLKRKMNQDAVFWSKNEDMAICVVADGMGGHNSGEVASNVIKQAVSRCWDIFKISMNSLNLHSMITTLKRELEKENSVLYQEYCEKGICGSTFVILMCFKGQFGILSAGDSRIYLKRGFSFMQITEDEVWENQAYLSDTERADMKHPNRGKLVNAFGSKSELQMRVKMSVLENKDTFLLCSDGLYKMCSERKISAAMKKARKGGDNMKSALIELRNETEESGATDNFSIVLLKVSE